jgi:hypothetical protein
MSRTEGKAFAGRVLLVRIRFRLLLMLILELVVVLRGQVRHSRVGASLRISHAVGRCVIAHVTHVGREALWLLGIVRGESHCRLIDGRVCVHRLLLLYGSHWSHPVLLDSILHGTVLIGLAGYMKSIGVAAVWLWRYLESRVCLIGILCGVSGVVAIAVDLR